MEADCNRIPEFEHLVKKMESENHELQQELNAKEQRNNKTIQEMNELRD
jgi:hypothetical protein